MSGIPPFLPARPPAYFTLVGYRRRLLLQLARADDAGSPAWGPAGGGAGAAPGGSWPAGWAPGLGWEPVVGKEGGGSGGSAWAGALERALGGTGPGDALAVVLSGGELEAIARARGLQVASVAPQSASEVPASCLRSLLDFEPENYGLPPFEDRLGGTVPLHPVWRLKGEVVKGFGRGSKVLGIPTANLDDAAVRGAGLGEAVSGIYAGWASVGADPAAHPMVMSIGWNPYFKNERRTVEPWILHDFGRDFYGEELRLVVCAYIRPEANFTTLEALVKRIHTDADVARAALAEAPKFGDLQADPFLRPQAEEARL